VFGIRISQGCVDGEVGVKKNFRENGVDDCGYTISNSQVFN